MIYFKEVSTFCLKLLLFYPVLNYDSSFYFFEIIQNQKFANVKIVYVN
jgi:hypothetical protein